MKVKKCVICLAALLAVLPLPSLAGQAVLKCSVQDNIDPPNRYQLRVTNSGKGTVPSGAAVKVMVHAGGSKQKVVSTKVSRDFTLSQALKPGAFTTLGPADNVVSCTASAKW